MIFDLKHDLLVLVFHWTTLYLSTSLIACFLLIIGLTDLCPYIISGESIGETEPSAKSFCILIPIFFQSGHKIMQAKPKSRMMQAIL